jgi:beta-lactamase class A
MHRVKTILCIALLSCRLLAQTPQEGSAPWNAKQQVLWDKLTATIRDVDKGLDGVLGVAIEDLTTGKKFVLRGDEVFPQASSIKIAVLAELYHQNQLSAQGVSGKAKLSDMYTLETTDLVPDSDIMSGLTPGITKITNRDLATMMVAVSDNSAANVLIDRVGIDNVNNFLQTLKLTRTRLRRKMMDLKAASEGRENVSTPEEMMTLLEQIYHEHVLNKEMTEDFIKTLSTHKDSWIARELPEGLRVADKPGSLEGVRNDVGIVFAQNRPYVICVMTTFMHNERDGENAISRISAAAYSVFDRLGRASEFGRVISPRNTSK